MTRASSLPDISGPHDWPWLQVPQLSGRRVCCRRWCWGMLTCRTRLRLRYEEGINYSLSCCQAIVLMKYLAHTPSCIWHGLGATHAMSAQVGCLRTACKLASNHNAPRQFCLSYPSTRSPGRWRAYHPRAPLPSQCTYATLPPPLDCNTLPRAVACTPPTRLIGII